MKRLGVTYYRGYYSWSWGEIRYGSRWLRCEPEDNNSWWCRENPDRCPDSPLIYESRIEGSRRYCRFHEADSLGGYVEAQMVTSDPRLSVWWMYYAAEPATSLFEAVERGAGAYDRPDVTEAIIRHMIQRGAVAKQDISKLTPTEIRDALCCYTSEALIANAELVSQHVLPFRFNGTPAPGDTLVIYYDDDYGPDMTVGAEQTYIVMKTGLSSFTGVRYVEMRDLSCCLYVSRPLEELGRINSYVAVYPLRQ
ncbi:MAG: hypothetical protein WC497_04690 [Patescibacteria group bacterium]